MSGASFFCRDVQCFPGSHQISRATIKNLADIANQGERDGALIFVDVPDHVHLYAHLARQLQIGDVPPFYFVFSKTEDRCPKATSFRHIDIKWFIYSYRLVTLRRATAYFIGYQDFDA